MKLSAKGGQAKPVAFYWKMGGSQPNTFLLDMLVVLLISQKDYELCGNRKDWEGEFGSVGTAF